MIKKNKNKKIAIITGVTGQDGSYLAEFLIKKGYLVHGLRRRTSKYNSERINHLINNESISNKKFFLHYYDITDSTSVNKLIKKINPDEVYNLAAQSHVGISFQMPEHTLNTIALGTLNLLEAINNHSKKNIKFYQASTSELYGNAKEIPQNEKTPFNPRSPYAISKLHSYWTTVNYREAYGIYACNGILFNHESPRRGENFVTRKITIGLSKIKKGKQKTLELGNIYSLRDWGHAKDYVKMTWMILQYKFPDDYVISTGKQYSVKDFISLCLKYLKMDVEWKGKGINEKAYWKNPPIKLKKYFNKNPIIKISEKYFRPSEVNSLLGDSSKAKKVLKWTPSYTFEKLVKEMIESDLLNES